MRVWVFDLLKNVFEQRSQLRYFLIYVLQYFSNQCVGTLVKLYSLKVLIPSSSYVILIWDPTHRSYFKFQIKEGVVFLQNVFTNQVNFYPDIGGSGRRKNPCRFFELSHNAGHDFPGVGGPRNLVATNTMAWPRSMPRHDSFENPKTKNKPNKSNTD